MNRIADEILVHPSIQRLKRVARALDELAEDVVFVGGSIAPLLQTKPLFDEARPTRDVDGLVASTAYSDIERLHDALRAGGFGQTPGDTAHIHRWISPDGDVLDLVPAGAHLGGSGQVWDRIALECSVAADLGDEVLIHHASAPAFLALKWAAHVDRGAVDPYASHDLEDIVALVASRATIVAEIRESTSELKCFLAVQATKLLEDNGRDDILAGHLNNAQDPRSTWQLVLRRLEEIRAVGASG